MHQQNNIGAAIFIKHFQKHINQLSSMEDGKMKTNSTEVEKQQTNQDTNLNQNTSQEPACSVTNKFNLSNENLLHSFQQQHHSKAESYEKFDYNLNQMTSNQLKYANSIIEKIKNPKSE